MILNVPKFRYLVRGWKASQANLLPEVSSVKLEPVECDENQYSMLW